MPTELWTDKWIIRHDNASSRNTFTVTDFLVKKNDYSIRSSCLFTWVSSCNFWLFSKLKAALKERRFFNKIDIQKNVEQLLKSIGGGLVSGMGTPFKLLIDAQREYYSEGDSSH